MKKVLSLRSMRKIVSNILYGLVIATILTALIGVNISKLYCAHCEYSHVHVNVTPPEKSNCCQGECDCCHKSCKIPGCTYHDEAFHAFYKITTSSEVEDKLEIHTPFFCCATITYSFIVSDLSEYSTNYLIRDEYPDLPPSQEWLCTYRC
ncbi:hypothetical protein LJC12_01515 [Odoribacter sp. OttesenSCG-928-J03]|nr:hypothetical protein [Odoribacter sp. OttesenSCG-928-J03]MDL2283187.1 hypothetical protein [Odoribacter sp. OttesenSCG-928-G04]MDL2331305.1 hypothetical protein [Odoribacter sp. OttesenSCG-928-A06]